MGDRRVRASGSDWLEGDVDARLTEANGVDRVSVRRARRDVGDLDVALGVLKPIHRSSAP